MVKVFPAGFFGPKYFKEIKGPFSEIELLACAGVTPENMKDYFDSGASAIAFGASVFKKDWLSAGDFKSIKEAIGKFVLAAKPVFYSANLVTSSDAYYRPAEDRQRR